MKRICAAILIALILALCPAGALGYVWNDDPEGAPLPRPNAGEIASMQAKYANADVIGRIQIPGTKLSYPVAQGEDNDYYLRHTLAHEETVGGTIFLDCRIGPLNRNRVLYGHRMKDGSMFALVQRYAGKEFTRSNSRVELTTDQGLDAYEVFATTRVQARWVKCTRLDFEDDEQMADWLAWIKATALFETGVDVYPGDDVLTLVTCTYEFDDARQVTYARRLRQLEPEEQPIEYKRLPVATGISLPDKITLMPGQGIPIELKVTPESASREMVWYTTGGHIADVFYEDEDPQKPVLYAFEPGEVRIEACSVNGLFATMSVIVEAPPEAEGETEAEGE